MMGSLVLLLVSTFWLASSVQSYGVSEHRVDFIKTVNGHEYNYHYHDGAAPQFKEHIKRSHQQPSQLLPLTSYQQPQLLLPLHNKPHLMTKPVIIKRPPTYKQPYHSKFFLPSSNSDQIYANEFDALPGGNRIFTNTDNRLYNSKAVFESHEKIPVQAIVVPDEEEDYRDDTPVQRQEVRNGSPKGSAFFTTPNSLQDLQVEHRFPYTKSSTGVHQSIKPASNSEETNFVPRAGSLFSNGTNPATLPGFHYIAGGFSYFNRHLTPKKENLSDKPYVTPDFLTTRKPFPSTESYKRPDLLKIYKSFATPDFPTTKRPATPTLFTTTQRPYTAPTVPQTTPAPLLKYLIQQRPTRKPIPPPRPYLAPELTTTVRPYVAPAILQEQKQQLKQHEQALNAQRSRLQVSNALSMLNQQNSQKQQPQQIATNGASRFRYLAPASTATPAAQKQSELYEPEFDIDIRIDLSSDAA